MVRIKIYLLTKTPHHNYKSSKKFQKVPNMEIISKMSKKLSKIEKFWTKFKKESSVREIL